MKKKLFLCIVFLLVLVGCGQKSASLNLNYHPNIGELPRNNIKIAIVEATYTHAKDMTPLSNAYSTFVGRKLEESMPLDYKIHNRYNETYSKMIQKQITADIQQIMQMKGFTVLDSYASFDEIPYNVKKDADLIIIPNLNIYPVVRNDVTNIPIIGMVQEGEIQLTGRIDLDMIEPISKEKIIIKKVDVNPQKAGYNSEKSGFDALITLINTAYPQVMLKLVNMIDVNEISASTEDIKSLKSK